jgi:hypothetical protein
LRTDEALAIYDELVLLAVSAEHLVILENQAAARSALLPVVVVGAAETAEARAQDDEVELLAGIDGMSDCRCILSVAHAVTGFDRRPRVAVRAGIGPGASEAGRGIGSGEGRSGHPEEGRARAEQGAIQEVSSDDSVSRHSHQYATL